MKTIYANVGWYAIILFSLAGSSYVRHTAESFSEMSDVRNGYDLINSVMAIFLITSAVGLILEKPWGYKVAQAANASLVVIPIAGLAVTLVMMVPLLSVLNVLWIYLGNIMIAAISLAFWLLLRRHGKSSGIAEHGM